MRLRLGAALFAGAFFGCGGDVGPEPSVGSHSEGELYAGDWPLAFRISATEPLFDRVILVTIDTLRADHVSADGYPRETTPFLDSLAERGVWFERAIAAVSHTAPSHATILTGLTPFEHGVLNNGYFLPPSANDLGKLFGAAGFETAAFLGVQFLQGLCTSFDHVEVKVKHSSPIVNAAHRWMRGERSSDRFFMWVHMYDPHRWRLKREIPDELAAVRESTGLDDDAFYARIAELHGLPAFAEGDAFDVGWNDSLDGDVEYAAEGQRAYLDFVDAYDAEIRFSDSMLRRLYRSVATLGLPGRTLWVVTSDHGEGLASHRVAGHGSRIYQEQLRVPLVIHATDDSLGPLRVGRLVQHLDLFPTLAEVVGAQLLGLDAQNGGASLWPLLRDESGWSERPAFAQRRPIDKGGNAGELYALQTETHKYLLHLPGDDELYDLEHDPTEQVNLVGRGLPEAEVLRALLEDRVKLYRSRERDGLGDGIPSEWMDELKALGYVR